MTTLLHDNASLPVAEVFASWQGEGRHAGRRCGFLRLGLCNLACDWCDTAYTWDRARYDLAAECPPVPAGEISDRVAALGVPMMVLTGGEPLIHAHPWPGCPLGDILTQSTIEWHLETNGTLRPPDWLRHGVRHVTVSPKLNTSDPVHRRLRPETLRWWALAAHQHWADFKFVARDHADITAAHQLVREYRIPADRVWVMPEGADPATLLATHRALVERIGGYGFNTTTRLHTLLWADERGR